VFLYLDRLNMKLGRVRSEATPGVEAGEARELLPASGS